MDIKGNHQRVLWMDVLKCLAIFEIYIGHFGESAGLAYPFVFSHHVQAFIFAAGCTENLRGERPVFQYVVDKFIRLLVPFYLFSLLGLVLSVVTGYSDGSHALRMVLGIAAGGIRNRYFAYPLWFLSCLFVITLLFALLRKVKNRPLMLLASLAIGYAAQCFIPNIPSWPYNIDSAFTYLFYYVMGYAAFPYIQRLFTEPKRYLPFLVISGCLTGAYTCFIYMGQDPFAPFLEQPFFSFLFGTLKRLLIIWFLVLLSHLLRKLRPLTVLGQETLYLCGNEFILKVFLPMLLSLFGIAFQPSNLLTVCLYTIALFILAHYLLVPWQRRLMSAVQAKLQSWRKRWAKKASIQG